MSRLRVALIAGGSCRSTEGPFTTREYVDTAKGREQSIIDLLMCTPVDMFLHRAFDFSELCANSPQAMSQALAPLGARWHASKWY